MERFSVGGCYGNYVLMSRIGTGTFGQVYEAIDNRSKRIVALKVVSPLSNALYAREYNQELTMLELCKPCDKIIGLHDELKWGNCGILVLDRMEKDLMNVMETSGHLSMSMIEKKDVFRQICEAVKFLHSHNIAHLDIKPENIFMNGYTNVVLGDFGSSYQWTGNEPEQFGTRGTAYYRAPETIAKKPYHPARADIWSLGIVLHVICVGCWPFRDTDPHIIDPKELDLFKIDKMEDKCNSKDLRILLEGMLHDDPKIRFRIQDVLHSDWLQEVGAGQVEVQNVRLRRRDRNFKERTFAYSLPDVDVLETVANSTGRSRMQPAEISDWFQTMI